MRANMHTMICTKICIPPLAIHGTKFGVNTIHIMQTAQQCTRYCQHARSDDDCVLVFTSFRRPSLKEGSMRLNHSENVEVRCAQYPVIRQLSRSLDDQACRRNANRIRNITNGSAKVTGISWSGWRTAVVRCVHITSRLAS